MPVIPAAPTTPVTPPQSFFPIQKLTPKFMQNVGQASSPFTFSSQYFDWQAQLLSYSVALRPMKRADADLRIAALLKGRVTPMQFGPVGERRFPKGTAAGITDSGLIAGVVTTAAASAGASTVATVWPLLNSTVFNAMDYIQLGSYLYIVLDDVVTDAGGNATITLFNRLRTDVASGSQVVFNYPQGLFRVMGNTLQYDETPGGIVTIGFDVVEAF